ncbi:RNA exonuclease 5-like [Neolamprologus brichardi]|uniref:RNA exonuclease 5-like n=1 Tax=Neolamprologus brichardi TaxID=32507 RepID=UPI00164371D3|nr:RNA exonuclease 5-like [Neolamprologus brichardi]
MESSTVAKCKAKKRKNSTHTAQEEAKRFKTEQRDDEVLQCGPASCLPRVSVLPDCLQQPIGLNELTELLQYAALGKTGGIKKPSWCRLRHHRKVTGVNVVIVEDLTQNHFYKHYLCLQHLRTSYTSRVTFTPSSVDVVSGILSSQVPKQDGLSVSKPDEELQEAMKNHPIITMFGTERRGLTAYVLTEEEMIKNNYPVKGMPGFEEFVCTNCADCVTDSSPLFGIDCEMCVTKDGKELTRVSLVDGDGKCLMDELVKPPNHILNYCTKFSGITPVMLQPVTTTLQDVQGMLIRILPHEAVLVGHSLEHDLIALKLIHKHVIDTSLLYKRECGRRFKLKVLTGIILKRKIQTEDMLGHHPTEDALAALELAQYFIKTGPRQVLEIHWTALWRETREEPSESHRYNSLYIVSVQLQVLKSFRNLKTQPFFSVLQFSTLSNHLKSYFPRQERHHQMTCSRLQDMCVVFAGPFPTGFSDGDVKQLFSFCGAVRKVKMLNTVVRVHAEIEFELLEGAMLAVKTLNGLNVLGQTIKVQRPVCESMLDLDVTLKALMGDALNARHLYAVKMNHSMTECISTSTKVNGHVSDAECLDVTPVKTVNGLLPAKINKWLHLSTSKSELCEESVRETFGHFGTVKRVILSAKPKESTGRARIVFVNSEDRRAALNSSEDLWKKNYLICPSLTPVHLPSWVGAEIKATTHRHSSAQEQQMDVVMRKLDRCLQKLFRFLPAGTLSVVVLLGHASTNGHLPGLCLMEVKQDC